MPRGTYISIITLNINVNNYQPREPTLVLCEYLERWNGGNIKRLGKEVIYV